MRRSRWVLAVVLVGHGAQSWATIGPSFHLDDAVWRATHVVVVTEGDRIDGYVTVIESWKGGVTPGRLLVIPELATFKEEETRTVGWPPPQNQKPVVMTGARMALFLVSPDGTDTPGTWHPAERVKSWGFRTVVAWVEDGKAYAIRQNMNPGPSVITPIGTEAEIKRRVADYCAIEKPFTKALADRHAGRVAEAFRAFEKARFVSASYGALEALGTMGEGALPPLRQLLADDALSTWHDDIIRALAAAGGAQVAPELVAIVEDEVAFWTRRAPTLKEGWWNADPAEQRGILRDHYGKLVSALRALRSLRYAPAREAVAKTRALWQSHAALTTIGNGQIAQECDIVLRELE